MNSQKYWEKRRQLDNIKVLKEGEKGVKNLKKLLKKNLDDVERKIKEYFEKYGDIKENLSPKEVLQYKKALKEAIKKVPKDKTLKKMLVNDAPKYKIDRLRSLQADLQIMLAEATRGQEKGIYNSLDDVAKISQAVLAKSLQKSIGLRFNTIAQRKLRQILISDWSGNNWTERLWNDRELVGKKVSDILQRGMVQGESLQTMARELKNATNQSFNNAFRLIRTETASVDSQVTLEGYKQAQKELGIKYFKYDAHLDSRTSQICREMNGKIFKIDDYEIGVNAPPLHPNCRSTTQLILDEEEEKEPTKELIEYKKLETPEAVNDFFYYDDEKRGLLAKKNSSYGQWAKSITAEEKEALTSYTGSGYSYMNDHLRGITILDNKDLEKDIQNLSNSISRFELKDNIKVYRGVDFNAIEGFLKENSINEAKDAIGKKYIDKGFMSTTPLKSGEGLSQFNGKEIQFEINVPKGKGRGAYINDFAGGKKDKEYEFLLQKGSSLTIEDVEEDETFGVIKFKMNLDV